MRHVHLSIWQSPAIIDTKSFIKISINTILTTTINIIILVYTRKLNLAKSFNPVFINIKCL